MYDVVFVLLERKKPVRMSHFLHFRCVHLITLRPISAEMSNSAAAKWIEPARRFVVIDRMPRRIFQAVSG